MRTLRRLKWPILLCVTGIGLVIWLVMSLFASFASPGISVLLPAETAFEITQTGKYTLWSEVEGSFDGKLMTFPTGLPSGVTIKITKKADGSVVPVHSKWPTTHRDAPRGYIRVAIGTVTFDVPGSYQIATEGLQEKRALYLDRLDFGTLFLKASVGSVGPMLFVVGLVWGIVVYISDRQMA